MNLRLNKFCCCCTTRTGALVIGTLGWILTLVQIFGAIDPNEAAREAKLQRDMVTHLTGDTSNSHDYSAFHTNIYYKIGYGLVTLLVCVLLIVGIYKKDKRFILPWLVLKGFEAILISIAVVIVFFGACVAGQGIIFLIFFLILGLSALHWYFWLCIWSHYKDLQEEPPVAAAAYSAANTAPPQYAEKAPYGMA